MKAKAVCVMRTDLRNSDGHKVPKSKLIAQGGHAFVGLLTNLLEKGYDDYFDVPIREIREPYPALENWLDTSFVKVVLGVDSEEELVELYWAARKKKLNTILITDSGTTEFGKLTNTCVGIGPNWDFRIDELTGHLKSFR